MASGRGERTAISMNSPEPAYSSVNGGKLHDTCGDRSAWLEGVCVCVKERAYLVLSEPTRSSAVLCIVLKDVERRNPSVVETRVEIVRRQGCVAPRGREVQSET